LTCLDAVSGKVIWSKQLKKEYGTKTTLWGFASHPLVDGDLVFVIAGGEGSECVAFNKRTGKEVWRALSATEPGYCPPTMIEYGGAKQLLIWHPDALCSLNPQTGVVLWTVPLNVPSKMTIV